MSDKIKRSQVDDINRRNNAVREFFMMLISILMKSNQTLTTLFR